MVRGFPVFRAGQVHSPAAKIWFRPSSFPRRTPTSGLALLALRSNSAHASGRHATDAVSDARHRGGTYRSAIPPAREAALARVISYPAGPRIRACALVRETASGRSPEVVLRLGSCVKREAHDGAELGHAGALQPRNAARSKQNVRRGRRGN
jgi:hypothetical protein